MLDDKNRVRFGLAIAQYKDVSDQLRRWEAAQVARGLSAPDAKRAVHQHLASFDLFAVHQAMFALKRNSSEENVEAFERELVRFEASIKQLRRTLLDDGTP